MSSEPIEIQPVIEQIIWLARQLNLERELTMDISPGLSILGDRDALKQIMLILLDNALKHSAGKVEVQAQLQNRQVEI